MNLHVVPVNDIIDHELNEDCVCGPTSELLEDGSWLVSHHSLDGREMRELEPKPTNPRWGWGLRPPRE